MFHVTVEEYLCETSDTMYSSIINCRLQGWVEQNNITGEYQAGFKRGYSTVDQNVYVKYKNNCHLTANCIR